MRHIFEASAARVLLLAVMSAVTCPAATDPTPAAAPDSAAAQRPTPAPKTEIPPALDVMVNVKDFGAFRIRLDRQGAPNASSLFLTLAASGAFDGLTFHRVVPGLLIQTGDPATRDQDPANDGTSVPPWRLPSEPVAREPRRGTVCFAWQDRDSTSAGMQWFVTLSDVAALSGRAMPIGEVVDGMEVVDRISQVSTLRNRRPLRDVRIATAKVEPVSAADSAATAPTPVGSAATKN